MLAQIPNHPPPSYLDRDPDVVSLRSAAPSYTSSIPPTYTQASTAAAASADTVASASHQHQHQQRRRLAAYTSLIPPGSSAADVATAGADPIPAHHHAYTVASWPSLSNQSQSRAYLNVAARRARRAQEQAAGTDVRRVVRLLEDYSLGGSSSSSAGDSGESDPATPAEEAALHTESRAWDFFTAQISDWDRREVSWRAFRARHQSVLNGGRGGHPKDKGKPRVRWGLYGRLG